MTSGNTSRFTDNPFRDPNATPEQLEWLRKRDEALRAFQETGDRGPAVKLGLFSPDPPGQGAKSSESESELAKAQRAVFAAKEQVVTARE